ncbi:cupin domain-containing protein [Chondrinema litorale]|uniref:cupin domain-containing protein n=1 Tax=Chondrinema litorale TaxID=2994555 RepID=UPI00254375B7|nr:cupin domain-containing protein [Chondrinema litorale]UZR94908.1 cupin domain-containing protein [Chondrinema litorale]
MPKKKTATYWIDQLNMERHPEGGYYKETYRCNELYKEAHLPLKYKSDRVFSTGIYFLLESNDFSSLHRITSDEMWHFYAGSSLTVYAFNQHDYFEIKLGSDFEKGQVFQAVVPGGYWFGAKVNEANSYALVGCTVAPGFDFEDFELAKQADLLQEYPQYKKVITKLTRT